MPRDDDLTPDEKLTVILDSIKRFAADPEYAHQLRDLTQGRARATAFALARVPEDAPDADKQRLLWSLWYSSYDMAPAAVFVEVVADALDVSEEWVSDILGDAIAPK